VALAEGLETITNHSFRSPLCIGDIFPRIFTAGFHDPEDSTDIRSAFRSPVWGTRYGGDRTNSNA